MPHVLLAGKLHPAGLALLREHQDFSFEHVEEVSEASYAPLIDKADAVVIRTQPMTAATIAAGKRLKVVSRHGVGYDAVDVGALTQRGIPLAIIGDVNSNAVAEHSMMLLLAASRRLVVADRAVRNANWSWRNSLEPREVSGKRLLIVGYGRIGKLLAQMARVFGMEVRAYDPFLLKQGWKDETVRAEADFQEALAGADFVSLHIPRTDRPVLGRAEFSAMKKGAVVINCARGGLLDEIALADAIRSGHLGGAGLDVFDKEPPAKDHPLFSLDQVIVTPHNAALTGECGERMAVASVKNVLDFFADRLDPSLIVNRAAMASGGVSA